ncbi:uncharacterized protein L201_004006 [Kwoniella dendrophila CBS 6074]|uniref:F-box domain-containing protein n=1 Tax=Kwoniella dendrophila CBS 6074 TaxID=1295534 RepID=A0AAX4JW05_9TREE
MDRLDNDILHLLFDLLDTSDILVCSRVCKHLHRAILDNTRIQLSLVKRFHNVPKLNNNTNGLTAREEIQLIQGTHLNLHEFRPVISTFDLPDNQEVYMVWNDYIITQPLTTNRDELKATGKHTVCTLWKDDIPQGFRLPFYTDRKVLAIDPDQDLILVKELVKIDEDDHSPKDIESDFGSDLYTVSDHEISIGLEDDMNYEVEEYLHAYHLFNRSSDPVAYSPKTNITNHYLNGERGQQELSILQDGKMMLVENVIMRMYDWRTWEQIARFPPAYLGCWESRISWVITSNNLLVGVDLPEVRNARPISARGSVGHEIASLAIFNLDELNPPSHIVWTPDLLLEIPLSSKSLPYVIKKIDKVYKYSQSIENNHPPNDQPILHETTDPRFLSLTINVEIDRAERKILKIVLPVEELRNLMTIHPKQMVMCADVTYDGIWGDFSNPFFGIRRISFSKWSHLAHVSLINHDDQQQVQYGWNMISQKVEAMKMYGNLRLSISDYNPFNFIGTQVRYDRYGSMRSFIWEDLTEDQLAKDETRTEPSSCMPYHKSPIPLAMAGSPYYKIPGPGSINYDVTVKLNQKGKPGKLCFDGKRLVVQMIEDGSGKRTAWILDFTI